MITIEATGATRRAIEVKAYPAKAATALMRALNRGIASARTVITRGIASETRLRQSDIRDALRMKLASKDRLEASLAASLKRIPLIKFNARGPEPSRGRGRGVTYSLKSGRGRHPNAFIATMSTGHRGVFVRATRKRLPLAKELEGPSLGKVMEKYKPAAVDRANEVIRQRLGEELKFLETESA